MDLHEIRRSRLIELLKTRFEDRQVDLARALSRPANYISRCLSDNDATRKPIGEKFARYVEETLGLPKYWMDEGTMFGKQIDPETLELALKFETLTPAQRSAVEAMLKAFSNADPAPAPLLHPRPPKSH